MFNGEKLNKTYYAKIKNDTYYICDSIYLEKGKYYMHKYHDYLDHGIWFYKLNEVENILGKIQIIYKKTSKLHKINE